MYYRRSTDGGKTWGLQTELVPDDSMSGSVGNRPLSATGMRVAFVWGNRGSGGSIQSVKIVRSTDAGETWLEPQVLVVNKGIGSYSSPKVSLVDDLIFVTVDRWVLGYYQYFMTRSYDGGVTWDSIRQITSFPESHGSLGDLIATEDHVFLTYERATPPSYREIWFMVSSDSGATWSSEQVISTIDDYDGWEPDIATDGEGKVYITWQDVKYGGFGFTGALLMRKSTDNGLTWGPEIRVSDFPSAERSSLSVEQNVVHVVWDDERSGILNRTIQYRGSTDGGLTWCPEYTVGDTLEIVTGGSVASAQGMVHVAYSSRMYTQIASIFSRSGVYSLTSVDPGPSGGPDSFRLFSAYPNPFNSQTAVVFDVRERTHTRLTLFDLLGREAQVMIDGIIDPGVHRVTLDGVNLSTGTYYLQLSTDRERRVRPIVLIR
jgi:hypothetical protein